MPKSKVNDIDSRLQLENAGTLDAHKQQLIHWYHNRPELRDTLSEVVYMYNACPPSLLQV